MSQGYPSSPQAVQPRRGFTLVESCIAIVIVATMLVASLSVAAASARARLAQQDLARGEALARQLLAEIVQQPYEQPGVTTTTTLGPEAGESRATFNDVDDFNGWSEAPPVDRSGNPLPGLVGWKRSVLVEWVNPNAAGNELVTASAETGLKRITVTVSSPLGKTSNAMALRVRGGTYDKYYESSATYSGWIGVTVQIGDNSLTSVSGAVNPLNQVP